MMDSSFVQNSFQKGKLTTIHGRPASGKTTMAVSLALALAKDNHRPVYFSMEMSKELLTEKIVTQAANELDLETLGNIFVNDTPMIKVSDIRDELQSNNADFIIIDYLQLMWKGGSKSTKEETQDIKNELKSIAKEFDIPVVVLSQMSRLEGTELGKRMVVCTE